MLSTTNQLLFRRTLLGASVAAGLTHVAFLALFYAQGVTTLVSVNVASVLSYAGIYLLIRRGRITLGWMLILVEVVVHATLAVYLLGWESGFHLYLILVLPIMIISTLRKVWLKAVVVTSLAAFYVGLDFFLRHARPGVALDSNVLMGLHYFNLLAVLSLLVFVAAAYYRFVVQSDRQLREMAVTDPLTRLRNRRSVHEAAELEVARMRRNGRPLSFVLCDLDHFKSINDVHGHGAGDDVLKSVAQVMGAAVREVDHAARWGGEEFLLLLPETPPPAAVLVANRVRQCVEDMRVSAKVGPLSVTVTIGVSSLHADESIDQAIARADRALYEGKSAGRNRVELSDEDAPEPEIKQA
ncbi:MAG: GGDEF domain-containing protein [Burkholderiales bacterium]|nr:GGDEF domain-containing protein [Burkholderiales bacterium]